jgi:hypothetical protein
LISLQFIRIKAKCSSLAHDLLKFPALLQEQQQQPLPDYLFFISLSSLIVSDPLYHLNALNELSSINKWAIGYYDPFSSLNSSLTITKNCELISFILPTHLFLAKTHHEQSSNTSNFCSYLNDLHQKLSSNSQYSFLELPVQLRYRLINDTNPFVNPTNVSIISMTSASSWDYGLEPIVSLDQVTDPESVMEYVYDIPYSGEGEQKKRKYICKDQGRCPLIDQPYRKQFPGINQFAPVSQWLMEEKIADFACKKFLKDISFEDFDENILDLTSLTMGHENEVEKESHHGFQVPLWTRFASKPLTVDEKNEIFPLLISTSGSSSFSASQEDNSNSMYSQLLQSSRPFPLFYPDPEPGANGRMIFFPREYRKSYTLHPQSKCSILTYAKGMKYLLTAYELAKHVHAYQSFLSYDVCASEFTNVFLYISPSTAGNLTEEYWNEEIIHFDNYVNLTFQSFLTSFSMVFSISDDEDFHNFIISDEELNAAMNNNGQVEFHHSAHLWWERMSILLHLPTQYNVMIDSDVLPCIKGFDSFWLEAADTDILSYVDMTYVGNTNGEERFPFPGLFPSKSWAEFNERLAGFLILQKNSKIQELMWRFLLFYRKGLELVHQGRTVIDNQIYDFLSNLSSLFLLLFFQFCTKIVY